MFIVDGGVEAHGREVVAAGGAVLIALPSMLIVMLALYYLVRLLRQLAGLTLADILHTTRADT